MQKHAYTKMGKKQVFFRVFLKELHFWKLPHGWQALCKGTIFRVEDGGGELPNGGCLVLRDSRATSELVWVDGMRWHRPTQSAAFATDVPVKLAGTCRPTGSLAVTGNNCCLSRAVIAIRLLGT